MFTYFKSRWPIIVVVVVLALVWAVAFGKSLAAACISIIGVLLAFMAIEKWRSPAAASSDRNARLGAEPFTFTFTWELEDKPDLVSIGQALDPLGFRPESSESPMSYFVFTGGSQIWTRLFGGYFVPLDKLPMRAEVHLARKTDTVWQLELKVLDRFGWAIRDHSRQQRPEQAAMRIKRAVDERLTAISASGPGSG